MRDKIIELAKANGADIVGFAPARRFESDNPIFKIMPETKTVIGLAFRVLRGIYRGIEEGNRRLPGQLRQRRPFPARSARRC